MSRPLRIEFPGAHYHVMSRGNARQRVFLDDTDCHAYLDLLGEVCVRFDWHCHAHCLMPNHVHLLIETRTANLSRGMRHLNGVFTQRFNERHGRVGHLFQGRYKAPLVDHDAYLLGLVRYILLNPVRAGLVGAAADWRWSSHAWASGQASAPRWAAPDRIWHALGAARESARRSIAAFIDSGVADDEPDWESSDVLGCAVFRESISPKLDLVRHQREFVVASRFADRPALGELLGAAERDEAIATAVLRWGYSQAEVVRHLGLSKTTVSKVVNRRAEGKGET